MVSGAREEEAVDGAQLAVHFRDDERGIALAVLEVRLGVRVEQPRSESVAVVVGSDVLRCCLALSLFQFSFNIEFRVLFLTTIFPLS